jgi:signal transduction histidine kinase
MAFLDTLREYLQEILDRPDIIIGMASPDFDPAAIRSHLIRCLERLEEQDRAAGETVDANKYTRLLGRWHDGDAVVLFARRMSHLLRQGMSKGASAQEIQKQIEVALARTLGLPDELPSVIRTLELDRLSSDAQMAAFPFKRETELVNVGAYAAAIRAARRTGTSLALTPIGRVLLELTGRDAIRWLLHVEVAQSTGPEDEWRVSRETARALGRKTEWVFDWEEEAPDFPHSWATLRRLRALGLVSITENEQAQRTWLKVLPLGQELLGEIESGAESPMSILAKSLLADLSLSAAEVVSKPSLEEAGTRASTAEATARQARLVAHEIRNALVPVKTSLGALYREMLLTPASETLARRRESIDRGIDAVFHFVEQLVKISSLAATPPEPFDPLATIRDAISLVESETARRLDYSLPETLPPVSGHRARVVMAITNVLRNAVQAAPGPEAVVRISAESWDDGRAVLLSIEDNGPGVPENMRQAIFEEGISLRPGGIGMGLALVREVFEKEMKGLVDCGASQLGGARFVIRLPAAGVH